MATAVRVRFPPSAPARHQGLWQVAATLSFFVVSSSAASPARPLFFLPLRIWVKQVVQKVPQMPSAAASSAHPHGTSHSPPNTPSFRPASSLCGPHLLFSLCSACCCQKRLGNAEIRLSLGTCFRQEAKLLACRLFALLHASLPGVPDLPTLRHILVRHLSSMQGKDVSEYGKRGPRKTALPCSFPQPLVWMQEMQEASRFLLFLVIGNQHIRPQDSLHLPVKLFVRISVFIHYPNQLQQKFPHFPQQ